ncbi:hypothetical protein [Streptomyces olivaceoviridis]|uniref:hypothetical protein n=1 Tax=Streptomyces olivaceoviridis TaxID=1921 RepID=UPI0037A01984
MPAEEVRTASGRSEEPAGQASDAELHDLQQAAPAIPHTTGTPIQGTGGEWEPGEQRQDARFGAGPTHEHPSQERERWQAVVGGGGADPVADGPGRAATLLDDEDTVALVDREDGGTLTGEDDTYRDHVQKHTTDPAHTSESTDDPIASHTQTGLVDAERSVPPAASSSIGPERLDTPTSAADAALANPSMGSFGPGDSRGRQGDRNGTSSETSTARSGLPEAGAVQVEASFASRFADAVAQRSPQVLNTRELIDVVRAAREAFLHADMRSDRGVDGGAVSLSPRNLSEQHCLALLLALRDELFTRGIAPGRTTDDNVIRRDSQEGLLAPGAVWRSVRDWVSVEDALRSAGPGSAAFVLARRPTGKGHAFAAYSLVDPAVRGGENARQKIVWLNLQQERPEESLHDEPPTIAPVDARAVIIDRRAKVVDHVLPEFQHSTSEQHSIVDPPTNLQYGAWGLEIEHPHVIDIAERGDIRLRDVIATHTSGSTLVVEAAPFWVVGDALYAFPSDVPEHETPTCVSRLIIEHVFTPAGILPGENRSLDFTSALELANDVRRILARGDRERLARIFSDVDGWTVAPRFGDVRIRAAVDSADGDHRYTQFTLGVPTDALLPVLHLALARLPQGYPGYPLFVEAREFGRFLAERFAASHYGRSLPPGAIDLLAWDPWVREVWGYGWLTYYHALAAPYKTRIAKGKTLAKNVLPVASRNPLGKIREALQPAVRQYLDQDFPQIKKQFTATAWKIFSSLDPETPVQKKFNVLQDDLTHYGYDVEDYLTYAMKGATESGEAVSQRVAVGMSGDSHFDELDQHQGVPLALLEMRRYGRSEGLMSPRNLEQYSREIVTLVRQYFSDHATRATPTHLSGVVHGVLTNTELARLLPLFSHAQRHVHNAADGGLSLARFLSAYALRGTPLPESAAAELSSLVIAVQDSSATAPQHVSEAARAQLEESVRTARRLIAASAPSKSVQAPKASGRTAETVVSNFTSPQSLNRPPKSSVRPLPQPPQTPHASQPIQNRPAADPSLMPTAKASNAASTANLQPQSTPSPSTHPRYPEPSQAALTRWNDRIDRARRYLATEVPNHRVPTLREEAAKFVVARYLTLPPRDGSGSQGMDSQFQHGYQSIIDVVSYYLHRDRAAAQPIARAFQTAYEMVTDIFGGARRPAGMPGGAAGSEQTRHSPGRDYEPTGQPAVVPPTASTRGGVTDLPVSQRSFAPNDPWLNAWAASRNWTIDIAITRFTEASGIVNRALGYVAVIGQESAEVKYRDRLHRVVAAVAVARAEAPTSATGKETEHDSTSEYDAALIERLTAITTALDGYNQAIRQAVQDPAADHTHHISDRQSAVEEASNNAQDLIPGLDPGDVHHLYRYQTQQNLPAGASVYLPGEPHPTRPVAPRALVSPGSVPAGELTHRRHEKDLKHLRFESEVATGERHEVKPLAPDKSAFDKLHDVWRGAGASVQRWTGAGRNSVRSALAKAWAQKAPVVKSFDAEPSLTRDVQPRSGHDQYEGAVPWHRRLIGKADLNQVPADISIPRTVRLRFALHPEGRIPVTELGLQHEQLDKWFPGGTDPSTSTTPPAPPRGGSASTQTSSVVPEGQGQPTTGIAVDGARPKALGTDTRATAENRPVVGTERGSALLDGVVHLGSEKPHDEWDKFAAENPEKSRHVLAALSGIFTRQGMSGEEWDDTAKRAYGALPAAVRNRNSRDVAQAIFNQMAHGTPYPMIGAGYSIDEIDDLVAEHVAHLRASNFDREQVPQDTEVFLQFIESDAGQDNAIRPDHAREVMRVVEGVKVRHDSLISPELLSRYSALSPQRAQYVERQPLGRAGLLDEDGPFYYLVASARTPDGQLPEGAAASWDTLSGGTVDRVVQGIEENAGITVHGIEDEALRLLVDRRRFDYPELLAYLSRPDNSRHDDMQPFMAPHEFIYRDVRVIFHFDPHSRPKMNSGEDIIDALNHGIQQQDLYSQIPAQPNWSVNGREFLTTRALLFFLRMIDGLDAGGLSIPDTIDVYAPLYSASMDVYPVMDDHGILVDLRVERIGTWNLEETAALYCDPGALIITPSATIQYRPYDPRYLSTSTHDFSFVTGLHEGLHWIAARTNRGANMDIFATRFRQEFVRDALMVSEYAASDPAEFIAEYGTATLLGRDFGDASARLERMYLALGGPRIENVLRSHLSEDEISQLLAGVNHILSERGVPAVDQATIAHFYDGLSQYDAWAHPDVLEELIAEDVESMYNNVRGLASPSGWQFTISQPDEPSGMAEGSPLSDHTASDARPHVPRLLIGGGLPESSLDSPWESTDKQLLSPLSPGLFGEAAPPPWARNDAPVSSSPRIGGVPVTAVSPVSPWHAPDKLPMSPGTPRTPRTPRLATNSPRAHDGAQWRGSPRIGRIAETSVSPASPRHAPDKLPMPPGTPRTPKTPRLDTGSPRIVRMADTSDSMRRGLAAIAEEDPRFRGYLRQWRPDTPQHSQPQPDGEKATGAPTRPAAASTQPTATPPTHHDTGARGLETVNLPPAAEALFTMNTGAGPLGNSEGWWLGDKSEAVIMPRSENAAPGASENRRGRLPADTSGLPFSVADSGAAAYDLADVSMAPGEGGDLPPLRLEYIRAVEQDLKAYMELATFGGVSREDTARGLQAMRRAIGVKYKNLTPEEKRAEIFERNLRKYGDPLGPSVEWLRKRGKSWEEISDSAVRTGGEDLGLGKARLGPTGDADDGAGGGISEEFTGPQSRDAVVAPPEAETLVAELPRMPHSERVGALEGLTPGQRRWLSRSVRFVAALRREVSSEEMAWTAAHLLVHGDLRADEPASARAEARAQVARMLQNPKVAGRLLNGRAEVLITPRDVHVTDLHALRHLRGKRAGDGRSFDTIRGVSAHGVSAVTEENLLGGETFVGGGHHYPDGFSTATHEIAHAIFDVGLLPADKQVVGDVYHAMRDRGMGAQWPDGSRTDGDGREADNYSSTSVEEFFAQLSNAWLGTNHGTDPQTGQRRNNGAAWVRTYVPALVPLLETLYGSDPAAIHSTPANPVNATRADEEKYAALRDFTVLVETSLAGNDHGQGSPSEPQTLPDPPLQHKTERADPWPVDDLSVESRDDQSRPGEGVHALEAPPPKRPSLRGDETPAGHGWAAPAGSSSGTHRGLPTGPDDTDGAAGSSSGQSTPSSVGLSGAGRRPAATTSQAAAPAIRETAAQDPAATPAQTELTMAQRWQSRLNPEATRPDHNQVSRKTAAETRATTRMEDKPSERTMDQEAAQPRRAGNKHTAKSAAAPHTQTDTSGNASSEIADQDKDGGSPLRRPR